MNDSESKVMPQSNQALMQREPIFLTRDNAQQRSMAERANSLIIQRQPSMRHRYFLIEPKFNDLDTFCHFVVGSDRVRASIQIYADMHQLGSVIEALLAPSLDAEWPICLEFEDGDGLFYFYPTVLPHQGGEKTLRFRIFQDGLDDGAPYRADIRFKLTSAQADELAKELKAWCNDPVYAFIWTSD